MKLSVVLVTRNEAELLEACLSRLGFEDELIVLDMHSIDGSPDVAKRFGARVVTIEPEPFVERVRNGGLDEANGEWILYLDPDEFVPPGYGEKLRAVLERSEASAYYVPFRQIAFGRTLYHGQVQAVLPKRRWFRRSDHEAAAEWPTKMCLYRAGTARWPDNCRPHTEAVVDGPIERLALPPIDHHLFRSVEQQMEKHVRYVTNAEPLAYGSRPLTPWIALRIFYKHMVVERWWRDGTVGIAEGMMFTMKDWMSVLHEWEWREHPDPPLGRGARALFTTAELLHEVGSVGARTRRLAWRMMRRAGGGRRA